MPTKKAKNLYVLIDYKFFFNTNNALKIINQLIKKADNDCNYILFYLTNYSNKQSFQMQLNEKKRNNSIIISNKLKNLIYATLLEDGHISKKKQC
jgi:hypothetical protein